MTLTQRLHTCTYSVTTNSQNPCLIFYGSIKTDCITFSFEQNISVEIAKLQHTCFPVFSDNNNNISLSREHRTVSSSGRYGGCLRCDRCLKQTSKHGNNIGRRQPMTSLPARPQYKRAPGEHVILFFVFTNHLFMLAVS